MAIGALQTGYNTLYGKVAGLGTQNGQTRGSSFREHIDGTERQAERQRCSSILTERTAVFMQKIVENCCMFSLHFGCRCS